MVLNQSTTTNMSTILKHNSYMCSIWFINTMRFIYGEMHTYYIGILYSLLHKLLIREFYIMINNYTDVSKVSAIWISNII